MIWQIILPNTPLGNETAEKYLKEFENYNIKLLDNDLKGVFGLVEGKEQESNQKVRLMRLSSTNGAMNRFRDSFKMRNITIGHTRTIM